MLRLNFSLQGEKVLREEIGRNIESYFIQTFSLKASQKQKIRKVIIIFLIVT